MNSVTSFLAGFATGWLARSTVDTSRDAVVNVAAGAFGLVGWARRVVATEREFFSDLLAEARARARIRQAGSPRAVEDSERPLEQHA